MHQQYSKFICFSKEAEEKLSKMSEYEIDMLAYHIAESARKSQMQLMREQENARLQ
jgi:hypothetical protein